LVVEVLTNEASSSGGDSGLFDSIVERVFELAPGFAEGFRLGDGVGKARVELSERWVDDSCVGLRKEDGDPAAVVGQLVALTCGDAAHQAFEGVGGAGRTRCPISERTTAGLGLKVLTIKLSETEAPPQGPLAAAGGGCGDRREPVEVDGLGVVVKHTAARLVDARRG
jgi:hypothetical protein